jgi:DNA-binding SARP family transcriptional activator
VDGRLLPRPSTQKTQSLLAYVIMHSTAAHSREKLAGLLWPEADDDRAQRSLRTALWSGRRLLSSADARLAESLLASRLDVRWLPAMDVELDLQQFERAMASWRQARTKEPLAALAALQSALAIYRGPLLEGLYDDWCLDERYRLEEHYLSALAAAVSQLEAVGQLQEAVACAQRLLASDPLREEIHRTVIRLLGDLGDRSAVLRQYQHCKEILARELDEPPSAETEVALASALQAAQARKGAPRESLPLPLPVSPVAPAPVQQPPATASGDRLPLLGRETQWQALTSWIARTEAGQGRTMLIAGEAGSGKTRLLEEIAARARWRSVRVLWGTCYEYERMLPYQPFTEALRAGVQPVPARNGSGGVVSGADPPATDRAALSALPPALQQALLLLVPDWADRVASHTVSAQELGQDQAHVFAAVAQYVKALARDQALLLIIDDLQWAAPSTLQLFHHLARAAVGHPILLIGSYRPEDVARAASQATEPGEPAVPTVTGVQRALRREGALDTLLLERLSPDDVAALVAGLTDLPAKVIGFGDTAPTGTLAAHLHRFTEGNPLFLAAAIAALRDGGNLTLQAGQASWPIPARIQDLFQERLEHVRSVTREALTAAAVAGCEFDMAVLQRVWGRDEEQTLQAVDDLLANGMVREVTTRGARDFAFSHHLFQQSIYDTLPLPVRMQRHRKVAEAMDEVYGTRASPVELAFHYERGGCPEKAILCAWNAGVQAASSFANRDADVHFSHALTLLQRVTEGRSGTQREAEQRFDLLAARATVRQRTGVREQVMSDITQMLATAQALRDLRREAAALLERSTLHTYLGRYSDAQADAEAALACAQQLAMVGQVDGPDRLLLAQANTCLGSAHVHQNAYEPAIGVYRRALATYRDLAAELDGSGVHVREQARRGEADVLDRLGHLYQQRGSYAEARRHHLDALEICRASNNPSGEASALQHLGGVCWYAGDLAAAQEYWQSALDLERRIGHRRGEGTHVRNLGLLAWRRRDFTLALTRLAAALAIFEDLQDPDRILECYHGLGDVRFLVGPLDQALDAYEKALAIARSTASKQRIAQSLFGCARAERALGHPDRVVSLITEARALCQSVGWPRGLAWCDREEGLALLDLGNAEAARALLTEALESVRALAEPSFVAAVQAELAAAYLAVDERATARRLAEEAAAAIRAADHGVDQPQAILFALYRVLSVQGDHAAAHEALASAHREIGEQESRLSDPQLRESFRHTVPINRQIAAAWQGTSGG